MYRRNNKIAGVTIGIIWILVFSLAPAVKAATFDSDQDGLSDRSEEELFGTSINEFDTDGDGLSDGFEAGVVVGAGADGVLETEAGPGDTVSGGAVWIGPDLVPGTIADDNDLQIIKRSLPFPRYFQTDPTLTDTDGDGRSDGEETKYGSHPLNNSITPASPASPSEERLLDGGWAEAPELAPSGESFLAVWQQCVYSCVIYSAPVDNFGIATGSPTAVVKNESYSIDAELASSHSGAGMAWEDYRDGNWEIYFRMLDRDGNTLGGEVRLSRSEGHSIEHSIAWSGSEFAVAWTDSRDGDWEVYLSILTEGGTVAADQVRVSWEAGEDAYPEVAWNGSEFVVAWQNCEKGGPVISVARFSPNGEKVGETINVSGAGSYAQLPGLASSGSEMGAVWQDHRDGNWEIYFRSLNLDGSPSGDPVRISFDPDYSLEPEITWAGGMYVITWIDTRDGDGAGIYMARVSPDGRMLGPATPLVENRDWNMGQAQAWSGGVMAISWERCSRSESGVFTAAADVDADSDGDGLTDSEELNSCTDPLNYDSDFDGEPDSVETDSCGPSAEVSAAASSDESARPGGSDGGGGAFGCYVSGTPSTSSFRGWIVMAAVPFFAAGLARKRAHAARAGKK